MFVKGALELPNVGWLLEAPVLLYHQSLQLSQYMLALTRFLPRVQNSRINRNPRIRVVGQAEVYFEITSTVIVIDCLQDLYFGLHEHGVCGVVEM